MSESGKTQGKLAESTDNGAWHERTAYPKSSDEDMYDIQFEGVRGWFVLNGGHSELVACVVRPGAQALWDVRSIISAAAKHETGKDEAHCELEVSRRRWVYLGASRDERMRMRMRMRNRR